MSFDTRRATRPHLCCRVPENLRLLPVEGVPGAGVLARVAEQCQVCGCRHFGVVLQPGVQGVAPSAVEFR